MDENRLMCEIYSFEIDYTTPQSVVEFTTFEYILYIVCKCTCTYIRGGCGGEPALTGP